MAKSERAATALSRTTPESAQNHKKAKKKASNSKKKDVSDMPPVVVEAESAVEPAGSLSKRASPRAKNPSKSDVQAQTQLMERCRSAFTAFMPLVNRLPRDLVIADESLSPALANPLFQNYSERNDLEASQLKHCPTSELLRHLQTGLYHAPVPTSKTKPPSADAFKRPLSPPRSRPEQAANHNSSKKAKKAAAAGGAQESLANGTISTAEASRLQLKQRLHDKLLAFKAKRKALLSPEESHEAHVLRGKLRKLKKKEKTREKKSQNKKKKPADGSSHSQPGTATPSSQRSSSIVSEEGRMIFSRFDFFQTDADAVHPKQAKGKNLTHLLNKAEADQRKLQQAEAEDEEKGKELRQKKAWQEALLKAQGVKLKNDPDKLRKALKEQKKRKKRSERKWTERTGHVHKEQKERQDKRQKNLDKRKEAKQAKKRQKAIKKGHLIPGFN
ncbi:surfeit locus protein 6-like [Paramacrobiotus metropolitanus]|uniref:surfeit locus protein 6-like n=1 Tax=Paramacrobiotus metropolitanus TaxID=2943436 RepID=UPI00244630D7|nr:surfeit locus protein 6-like [Paramacrobiotus metropolitanus]